MSQSLTSALLIIIIIIIPDEKSNDEEHRARQMDKILYVILDHNTDIDNLKEIYYMGGFFT